MNEEQIYLLLGKAWEEMYPDRTKWINMSKEAKNEWVNLISTYEKHREIYCIENAIQ